MPDVDLVATKDFSYATRRLKAGDPFTVDARMARVLVGIGKAEHPREVGKVAAPPKSVVERAATVTPARVEEPAEAAKEAPKPVAAVSTRTVDKPKTTRRRTTRKSTAKK